MSPASLLAPLALLASCAALVPVHAEDGGANASVGWHPLGEEASAARDVAAIEALVQAFPDSGTLRLRLLTAQFQDADIEGVLATLDWLKQRGYVFTGTSQQQIPKLVGKENSDRARALLIPEGEVIAASSVIDTVPADAQLVESVVRDPKEDRLIVTSVIGKAVFGHKPTGGWDGYAPKDAANLSGIALDPDRRIVWIASGHIDGSESKSGFAGLIGLDHRTDTETRIPAPSGVSLSDITLAPDGTFYASDPAGGGVYRASPDATEMDVLIPPGTFRSPQGLALNDDGGLLYVSDYRYGIAIVDLATKKISRLATGLKLILDGVDGMWRHGQELIVVQNGTSPMRISAFKLADDGMSVVANRILEQANPAWTEPLSGNLDGDSLLYVGNGQWDRFVAGEPAQDKASLPTQIRRLPLD